MRRSRRRHRPFRWLRLVAWTVALLAAGWLAGLVLFAQSLPRGVETPLAQTDAVVVLTGGTQRIEAGFAVLAEGKAKRMLISGVNTGTGKAQIAAAHPTAARWLDCCTDLGFAAADTTGNAIEIAEWAKRHGFRSLRVVTAAFHMPRSLFEIGQRLDAVALVAHPVFPPLIRLDRWWLSPGTAELIAGEYVKYLFVVIRAWASDTIGRSLDAWLEGAR